MLREHTELDVRDDPLISLAESILPHSIQVLSGTTGGMNEISDTPYSSRGLRLGTNKSAEERTLKGEVDTGHGMTFKTEIYLPSERMLSQR